MCCGRDVATEAQLKVVNLVIVQDLSRESARCFHALRIPSTLREMGVNDLGPERAVRAAAARRIADAASTLLLQLRAEASAAPAFDPNDLRLEGDQHAHALITDQLRAAFPNDAILSEEAADDETRLRADRVWIVDPLDGTREFGERDEHGVWRTDFAIHIALWEKAHGLTVGVVALPARALIVESESPPAMPAASTGSLRLAVSRSRPPAFIEAIAESGRATLHPMGSAGVKATAVITGEVDAYVHSGGQYQWDSAAPVAAALAAGYVATRLDGSPLRYNVPDLLLPDLIICHPARVDELRALLNGAGVGFEGSAAESPR